MVFSIVNEKYDDNFIIDEETIEECQTQTMNELAKRGWDMGDCYSLPLS